MSFILGDILVDRLLFGYGAKSNGNPLYVLSQLKETSIEVTADSTDITDKDGNLVYRKYSGKKGEVTAQNTFLNLAIAETLSATTAEIATSDHAVVMPMFKIVNKGEELDLTDYVEGSVVVSALSVRGSLGKNYSLGSSASDTEFFVDSNKLKLPEDEEQTRFVVRYNKKVKSGAKITNSAKNFPKAHELFFKALVIDPCDKESFRAAIIHIPSFIPSPEMTLALQGGDSQTMDFKGAMMVDPCSADQELFSIYYIDEEEEAA